MLPDDHDHRDMTDRDGGTSGIRFPSWLITYSDLITLLLTFFILLLSMADLDPVRFNEASNSLKGALGLKPLPAGADVVVPVFPITKMSVAEQNRKTAINQSFENLNVEIEQLEQFGNGIRSMRPDSNRLLVRIGSPLLFAPGSEELLPGAHPFLDIIARNIKDLPIDIRIEGHTDDTEASAEARTNPWELSNSRAVAVLRYFVQQRLIPIERLSAVGYGEQKPLVPNSTNSNRLLNRRVDLLLQADFTSGTAPASKARSPLPL